MMKIGIVTQLDPAGARVRVKFPEEDAFTDVEEPGMESYWLQVTHRWTTATKEFSMPAVGDQVVCLMDENLEFGVVLGGLYSAADPRPAAPDTSVHLEFSDGTVLEYDPAAHLLKADVQGGVDLTTTGAANLTIGGAVDLQAASTVNLDASGAVTASCPSLSATVSATATIQCPVITLQGFVHITGGLQIDGVVTGSGGTGSITFQVPVTMQQTLTAQGAINATGAIDSLAGMTLAGVPYSHP